MEDIERRLEHAVVPCVGGKNQTGRWCLSHGVDAAPARCLAGEWISFRARRAGLMVMPVGPPSRAMACRSVGSTSTLICGRRTPLIPTCTRSGFYSLLLQSLVSGTNHPRSGSICTIDSVCDKQSCHVVGTLVKKNEFTEDATNILAALQPTITQRTSILLCVLGVTNCIYIIMYLH